MSVESLQKLLEFIGLTGYYQYSVENWYLIAQPLIKQLKKDTFMWDKPINKILPNI